jgi:hypothetical protein
VSSCWIFLKLIHDARNDKQKNTDNSWLARVCVDLHVGTDRVSIYGYMRLSQLHTLVQSITQQEVKSIKIVRIIPKDNTDNLGTH